jgi:tRNA(Ile)-lysidine synthase
VSTRKPDGFDTAWLDQRLEALLASRADVNASAAPPRPRKLLLALSGGLDSVALLHALAALCATPQGRKRWALRAVHVHHHLQPAADAAASLCRRECRRLAVPLSVRHLSLGELRGESVEAAAREARYAACAATLRSGEVLLTAHHDDDQLETVLLQLLRGAGVAGLAGMPALARFGRGWQARPLLGTQRALIERWARSRGLHWIDDVSNLERRFDRNYLRLEVLPALRARWPAAARVVARSAAHLAEAHGLLTALGQEDLARTAVGEAVDVAALACLPAARQRNLLRVWLAASGLRVPDAARLERVRTELPQARADANPAVTWQGGSVRRHRGLLYAVPDLPAAPPAAVWNWRRQRELQLGAGLGRLRLVQDRGGPLALAKLPTQLLVGCRRGGEQLRLETGSPRRALKDLLREAGVLPWWRERLPVIRDEGRVVAVADLWCDVAYRATQRTRQRARIEWVESADVLPSA